MAETKQLTFKEIAEHNTKKDLYLVVYDKVYNVSSFVDEHPGGEEVLLDVAGQDGTEAFEDVGHSDEARDMLNGMYVADIKREPGDPEPKTAQDTSSSNSGTSGPSSGFGIGVYAFLILGGAVAYGVFQYLQNAEASKQQ